MRTEILGALCLALGALAAPARAFDTERLTVGIPAEVDLVGLAFGVHPELLVRPFQPDGSFHLRVAPGFTAGPELALLPLGVGVRGVIFPRRTVRPHVGAGLQLQTFLPYGHPAKARLDMTMEAGVDVRVSDAWRVGINLSPEFGWVGGFGLGFAARVGPSLTF